MDTKEHISTEEYVPQSNLTTAFSLPNVTLTWLMSQSARNGCTLAETIRDIVISTHETEQFLNDIDT